MIIECKFSEWLWRVHVSYLAGIFYVFDSDFRHRSVFARCSECFAEVFTAAWVDIIGKCGRIQSIILYSTLLSVPKSTAKTEIKSTCISIILHENHFFLLIFHVLCGTLKFPSYTHLA